ncbi:TetR/AcrR family transcriptional regulator [Aureimonas sp. AU20]|uniref:TetR/AcrR family transcriptional regulator n=1 Tax=Aureimonas sp. AU20 TaxID=1349819 RepID=UPI000722AA88|nr:TetR-like C-terminal domain-containing protein [Aureimonas sp. AU20]ALN75480.1 hypothetical protein M673_22320 [Aureimonas sp. AU20]
MATRDDKRQDLRTRIIEAAEARIAADGVQTLRARDVMSDVGAALGGLYNAFEDLDDLVLRVNSQTLARLKVVLQAAIAGNGDPRAALKVLALAYLGFAQDNPRLWSALFEHRYAPGKSIPDWHLAEQTELLAYISAALRPLQPSLTDAALTLRARTFFGAIHGIVASSLAGRFVGVSGGDLAREIAEFLDLLVSGMAEKEEERG